MANKKLENPVFLVPGFLDTSWTPWWWILARHIQDRYDEPDIYISDFSYKVSISGETLSVPGTAVGSVKRSAQVLEEDLREIDEEKVNIVAHSFGGLISRYYIEKMGGHEDVESLITLGTPHQGTYIAYLAFFTSGAWDMMPGSKFLAYLNSQGPPEEVDYTAVWNRTEGVIIPSRNARIPEEFVESQENTRNLETGMTHLGYFSRGAFEKYRNFLR